MSRSKCVKAGEYDLFHKTSYDLNYLLKHPNKSSHNGFESRENDMANILHFQVQFAF